MEPIALEDLALLEMLHCIDRQEPLTTDSDILQRLVDSGLASVDEDGTRLTIAGVELCKSLQHRVAAHAQAERILKDREESEEKGEPFENVPAETAS